MDEKNERELLKESLRLLNVFCEHVEDGDKCPLWPDRTKRCLLRDLEEEARSIGLDE